MCQARTINLVQPNDVHGVFMIDCREANIEQCGYCRDGSLCLISCWIMFFRNKDRDIKASLIEQLKYFPRNVYMEAALRSEFPEHYDWFIKISILR